MAAAVASLAACQSRTLQTIHQLPLPPPLRDGLVAHWNCDESGGANWELDITAEPQQTA